MGRRGVGIRPRLVGAKKVTTSPISYYPTPVFHYSTPFFHYPTPVFSLSYALKNHKKQILFAQFKEKQYLCTAVDKWEYIYFRSVISRT